MTGHRIEDFLARAQAEVDVPEPVGAERMAAQTRVLGEGLRRYAAKLSSLERQDISTVFSALLEEGGPFPYRRVFALGEDALTPPELSVRSLRRAVPFEENRLRPLTLFFSVISRTHNIPAAPAPTILA